MNARSADDRDDPAQLARLIGKAVAESLASKSQSSPTSPIFKQLAATGAAGAVAGGASYAAGQVAGPSAGKAVGAIGSLVTGGVSAAAAGGPAGIAAAGLIAVATSAKLAYESMKGFAAAASPDGLKSLDKVFNIFSAVIGQRLLPFFVLLGAAVLTAAEMLSKNLGSSVDEAVKYYNDLKPTMAALGLAVVAVTQGLMGFVGAMGKVLARLGSSSGKKMVEASDAFNEARSGESTSGDHQAYKETPGESAKGSEQSPAQKYMADFNKNLKDITKDIGSSLGGKAGGGVGGVEEQWKKVQQAAMGGALDKKMLEEQKKSVELLNKIAGNTGQDAKKPAPTVARDR